MNYDDGLARLIQGDALVFTYGEAMVFEWDREYREDGLSVRAWLAKSERQPIEAAQDDIGEGDGNG